MHHPVIIVMMHDWRGLSHEGPDTGQRIMVAFPKEVAFELEVSWRDKYRNLPRRERAHVKPQKGKTRGHLQENQGKCTSGPR